MKTWSFWLKGFWKYVHYLLFSLNHHGIVLHLHCFPIDPFNVFSGHKWHYNKCLSCQLWNKTSFLNGQFSQIELETQVKDKHRINQRILHIWNVELILWDLVTGVPGTSVVGQGLKGSIYLKRDWMQANRMCGHSFYPNICNIQRTSIQPDILSSLCLLLSRSFLPVSVRHKLSFIFPCTVCCAFVTCILSVGALIPCWKETITAASCTRSKQWDQNVFVWILAVQLQALYNDLVKVWPDLRYLSLIWKCNNQRAGTCSKTKQKASLK